MNEEIKTLDSKVLEQDKPFIIVQNNQDYFLLKFNNGDLTESSLNISYESGIKFKFDNKLGLYLPQTENSSRRRFRIEDYLRIITDQIELYEILNDLCLENYFEQNIVPYLSNETTKFKTPKLNFNLVQRIIHSRRYNKPLFTGQYITKGYHLLNDATKDFNEGEPVYIGSKRQVFIFNLSKDENGLIMNQTSLKTKGLLCFANTFLNYNRISEPIIVNSIYREQSPTTNLFYGEPEIITNDVDKALKHFKRTDFGYLINVLKKHYEKIKK